MIYAILVTITYSVYKSSEDDDLGSLSSCSPDLGNRYRHEMHMKNTPQNRMNLNSNRDNVNFMCKNGVWQGDDIYTISIPNDSEPFTDAQVYGSHESSLVDQYQNYDSYLTVSDHGNDLNNWPSHHTHSHETHYTSSHSTNDNTHTSSHDTKAASDYGSCDLGGCDAGNCDSGGDGGDDGGGDCGYGDD